MKSVLLIALLCLAASARETITLPDWRFHLGNEPAAAAPDFNDSSWKPVTVPHDWAWEAGPRPGGAQLDKGGYRIGGIGWYRGSFTLPASWKDRHVTVDFDAVYRDSTVWLNGKQLGRRPYGFISFAYDLTPHLKHGENTLAVRCNNSREPSARWYHPCGIFAPVRLVATDPDSRFARHGITITTPRLTAASATVRVSAEIEGSPGFVTVEILDPAGKTIARANSPASGHPTLNLQVNQPALWSPESPSLYVARISLIRKGTTIDTLDTPFGFRTIHWDRNTGFSLNGKVTKLKGVCEHLAGGPVGGAWPEPLIEWKLRLLKSMGCNAIRTAHNPQIPAFYQICDRLGIMVMDEVFDGWNRKAPQDYGALFFDEWWQRDVSEWIRRDRNHPSIIIWSVGNETHGKVASDIVKLCHKLDPTRPVTSGASGSESMDVLGVNGGSETEAFISKGPFDKPFIATEAPHTWQVRGFYKTRTWYRDGLNNKRQKPFITPDLTDTEIFTNAFLAPGDMKNPKQIFLSSYDNATVRINARQNWQIMRDKPWFSGHFRWTGFDYPGEAGYVHGGFPFHAFAGGALDLAGFEKDLYHLYRSQWTRDPMVHILPHWTHPRMKPGTLIPVQTYSNADEVELLLDDKSLGTRKPGSNWEEMLCQWLVPWKPGTLTAIARIKGREVARIQQHSAAAPTALHIESETTYPGFPILTLHTNDPSGHVYPYGENTIFAAVDPSARILSFENGHPGDPEPPVANHRRAFMGAARLFLQTSENPAVTFGAILGERRQLSSNLVAIDVQRIHADGSPAPAEFAIHYTLDGSEPTTASQPYSQAFAAPATCTVKAVAMLDGNPVLNMEESFGSGLGLHWASAEEIAASPTPDASTALQAESAKFTRAKVTSIGKGFIGTGYLDFKGREDSIRFYQENDGPAGDATLAIRYAHADPKRQRPLDIILNGKKVTTLKFPSTGSWTEAWRTLDVPCHLQSGANTLILRTTGQSAPNLDQVEFR